MFKPDILKMYTFWFLAAKGAALNLQPKWKVTIYLSRIKFVVSCKKYIAALISSSHIKLEFRVVAREEKLVGYRTYSNTFLVNHELIPLH